jgi:hypothetical protein
MGEHVTSNLIKLIQSIMVALLFVAGAANLGDLMPDVVAAWFVLVVGALSAALGYYNAHAGTMPADASSSARQLY